MNEEHLQRLLDKYAQGTCTPEELRLLQRFYESFQQETLSETAQEPNAGRMQAGIRARIAQQEAYRQTGRRMLRNRWLAYAAMLLLVAGMGIAAYVAYRQQPVQEIALVRQQTDKGQRGRVVLADGTRVLLNADTRLTYPEKFAADKREVMLEGEAFFEVAKNPNRPFIIKTGEVTTTVLGTSFNVKSFEEEPLQVTVATGLVKVQARRRNGEQEATLLHPNEQASYDGSLHTRTVDIDRYIAWKGKILYLEQHTMAEVAIMLERWFGITVVIEEEALKSCKISGQYMDESLTNVMESLQHILKITYRIEGDTLVMQGKGCGK